MYLCKALLRQNPPVAHWRCQQAWVELTCFNGHKALLLSGRITMQSIRCSLWLQMFHGLLICLCVSVGHNLDSHLNPTRIAEPIEVPCGVLTQVYYSALDGGPDPLRKRHFWGTDISGFSVKYWEYLECSQYFQSYLVGGGSDVACHCHYCSSL